MTGRLYGVGVGPGDPELMTLKAARLIGAAPVIAYPAAPGTESMARRIAAAAIRPGTEEIRIEIPMEEAREAAQAAYDRAAEMIAGHLAAGRDVVALCEGDPFLYGSFMYLFARLAPRFPCVTVPGVSALTAGAAAIGRPLAARNEVLTVLAGGLPEAELAARIDAAGAVAIFKVGRHLAKIRRVVEALGLTGRAAYVERASLAEERVRPLAEAPEVAPYFSMVLVSREGDPWLR